MSRAYAASSPADVDGKTLSRGDTTQYDTAGRHPDGSIASLSGTGQRAQQHSYSVASGSIRHTITLADGSTLAQTSTNGFGDTIITAAASTSGLIYARREYNAKGQLTRSYQDAGTTASAMAATVYEYDKAPDGRKGDWTNA